MRVTYVGHATVLLELDGIRLLTDPVLSGRVWHLRRHAEAPDLNRVAAVDAVLLSHLHGDHLHRRSLELIDPGIPVIAPPGSRSLLGRYGRRRVIELPAGSRTEIGGVEVMATPATHSARRPPFANSADAVGFVVSGSCSAYFAGDTGIFDEMTEIGALGENSGLDLALLPVWGWGPTLGDGHLNPHSAARAAAMIAPRIAVPIHWGTLFPFGLSSIADRYLRHPPHSFAAATESIAPEVRVEILAPGLGSLQLDSGAST